MSRPRAGVRPRGGDQVIPRPRLVRPGPPPAWAEVPPDRLRGLTVARVADALRARASRPATPPPDTGDAINIELPGPSIRPAAVLCALFDEEGEAHMVLTRRSARLRSHTGEVAFPGGRLDDGEEPLDAALREAHEEVGLRRSEVTIVGRLSSLHTVGRPSLVTPFVGALPARPVLRANPAEVARAFTVTLSELLVPGVFHEERWAGVDGRERIINFFELDGDTMWGATARMVRELLEVVTGVDSGAMG